MVYRSIERLRLLPEGIKRLCSSPEGIVQVGGGVAMSSVVLFGCCSIDQCMPTKLRFVRSSADDCVWVMVFPSDGVLEGMSR